MKTKFNPKDVPNWCKWMAVDESGACWAYSAKPGRAFMSHLSMWWPKNQTGQWEALYQGKPPKNWKDELYTWK